MSEANLIGDNLDIYGGESTFGGTGSTGWGSAFGEGDSISGLNPGQTGAFQTRYTLIANSPGSLKRVNLTFSNFNDPHEMRVFNSSLNVVHQAETNEKLDLSKFFYPVQSFSAYQKQTFVIPSDSSVNLDSGDFDTTEGEVGLIVAKADYYADATADQEILYWQYNGEERYVMGKFMILSGQVKNGYSWKGWDVTPEETGGSTGGFVFSNPTEYSVKLTILTAS